MMLGVFFPSLMGFGILVSGALIVYDLVHRMLPSETTRRRRRLAVGAHSVVARAAAAAGRSFPPPGFLDRTPRSWFGYVALATVAAGLAAAVVLAGSAAYSDTKGLFFESPWIFGLTLGFSIAFALAALMSVMLAATRRRLPTPLDWVVRTTPFGRLSIPPPADALRDDHQGGDHA